MSKWIIKAVVQKIISFLPQGHRINYLFQKYITRGVQLSEEYFEGRLSHYRHHAGFYRERCGPVAGIAHLEVGAGWYPIVPLCFFLEGASSSTTVDIYPHLEVRGVRELTARLLQWQREGRLGRYCTELVPERIERLVALQADPPGKLEEWLRALHIEYLIADARRLPREPGTIDFVTSNNTFEHIPQPVLEAILREFKRVLKKEGLMSHFVDMTDHFAHFDSSISIYNFLKYSDQQWRRIDNSIQPQNRLRLPHYKILYEELGIPILKTENWDGDPEALERIKLDASFREWPAAEMAVSHVYLYSKMRE